MFTCFLYIKPLPFSVEWGSHINSLYFSSVIFRCLFLKNEWGYISCVPCRGFCLIFLLVDWNIRLWPPVLDFLAHPAFSQVSFYGPFVHKLWQESKEKDLICRVSCLVPKWIHTVCVYSDTNTLVCASSVFNSFEALENSPNTFQLFHCKMRWIKLHFSQDKVSFAHTPKISVVLNNKGFHMCIMGLADPGLGNHLGIQAHYLVKC